MLKIYAALIKGILLIVSLLQLTILSQVTHVF